jgi:hypothetical protein
MAIRPSTPEIITVNSETLQTQIRDLLPSQNGFGSELQASNVITPIIDLTAAAEGSTIAETLQTAIAFGSQTAFLETSTSSTIANSPGFYRVVGTFGGFTASASNRIGFLDMSDGSSTKRVWQAYLPAGASGYLLIEFDLTFFLDAGVSLLAGVNESGVAIGGSIRQVATGDGTLVQPNGFPL